MGLQYFSHLPEELKERIVREHMREERKKEFLQKAIEDSCRRYELFLKEEASPADISSLSKFLNSLSDYMGNQFNTRCLIRWKKDVPWKIKYGVMEEQHIQLYGSIYIDDLCCLELFPPEEEDDVTYEDGKIVICSQLYELYDSLGIEVVYIDVSKDRICTPLNK
uniref:Clink n=1 Tax=Milk vetch dwarf virus TaxID=67585 RepID=A0A6M2YZG4_9VIRU|nr:Clink [Milk vetch dwarf virus]QED45327.1 Clink [Milk vetch dwarf virus]QED45329.1 Clink [Milk vetch dwarf virus]